jgi:hypothetical protein
MKLEIKNPVKNKQNNDFVLTIEGMTQGKLMALQSILESATANGPVQEELRSFLRANLTNKMREIFPNG